MHNKRQSRPIRDTLMSCKQLLSLKRVQGNKSWKFHLLRAWSFSRGKEWSVYQGFIMAVLASIEAVRQRYLMDTFCLLSPVAAVCLGLCYMTINSKTFAINGPLVDDLLLVTDIIESRSSKEIQRFSTLLMKFVRINFLITGWISTLIVAVLVGDAVFIRGRLPLPIPLPDWDILGDAASYTILVVVFVWEKYLLVLIGMTYGWIDALYVGAVLVVYALMKTLAESFQQEDCVFDPKRMRDLLRAHQILLNTGNTYNRFISIATALYVAQTVFNSIVTGFALMHNKATIFCVFDTAKDVVVIIRFGILSELLVEASSEVSASLYQSNWLTAMFEYTSSSPEALSSFRHAMVLVHVRAAKPMVISCGMMGQFSQAFTLKFVRALYTYYQGLIKFL